MIYERIEPTTLYKIICNIGIVTDYELISRTITSSDYEDGGASYDLIIKRLSDGQLFKTYYSDWDMDNTDYDEDDDEIGERCDLDCTLYPVEAKQKTITVYE